MRTKGYTDMKRPDPKKHDYCDKCDRLMPLLMPVSFVPGWPIVVWEMLCIDCRLNVRLSRHFNSYGIPGDVMRFSHRKISRDAYDEWIQVEQL